MSGMRAVFGGGSFSLGALSSAPIFLVAAVVVVLLCPPIGVGPVRADLPSSPHALAHHLEVSAPSPPSNSLPLGGIPPKAPAPTPLTAGSVGQVGYTWDLANDTTYARSTSPSLHWEPSALEVDNATGTLWVAWA